MTRRPDPRELSQRELEDYLDELAQTNKDDTPEFHRAYKIWEKSQ